MLRTYNKERRFCRYSFSRLFTNKFTVRDIDSERRNPDEVGWEFYSLRYISSNIAKEEETKKGTVIGFDSTIEFKPLKIQIQNR